MSPGALLTSHFSLKTKTMKRFTLFTLLTLIAALAFPAMAKSKTYRLNVGRFDKVKITDNVNVIYKTVPDSIGMAVFTGAEEFADAFIFSNNKGKLTIQVNSEDVNHPELPTLYIYSDYITAMESSSALKVTVNHTIPVPSFSAKVIGNGTIVANGINATSMEAVVATGKGVIDISGKCQKAEYRMVGTGKIEALGMEATEVKCTILGTGDIYCWPTKELVSKGIGSTKIYYKGNPEISKKGGGHILPSDSIPKTN